MHIPSVKLTTPIVRKVLRRTLSTPHMVSNSLPHSTPIPTQSYVVSCNSIFTRTSRILTSLKGFGPVTVVLGVVRAPAAAPGIACKC
jgi:hypothetical protein